jgi:regulator of replication initiation timing
VRDDGTVVSCTEKVKVMSENFDELKQIAQDALEDGLLMEVSEEQMRKALHELVEQLINPYNKI